MDEAKNFMLGMMQTLKERIGNPFIGAFAAAWFVWNFKIVLVILGKGPWEAKIKYIYTDLMKHWTDWAVHGYLIPAVVASLWIFALPPVFRWITVWHEKQLNKNREAIYGVTEQKVLTNEEAISLRTHILEEKAKLINEREDLSKSLANHIKEIGSMQKLVDEKNIEIGTLSTTIQTLKTEIKEKAGQIKSIQDAMEPENFDLNFEKKGLNQSIIHNKLREMGFNVTRFFFERSENLVAIDENYNYWPWVTRGRIEFNNKTLLEKGVAIDGGTAAVILLLGKYSENEIDGVIFVAEAIDELDAAGLKDYHSSLDYLLTLGLMRIQRQGVIQFSIRFFELAQALTNLGFVFKYRGFQGPMPVTPSNK